MPQVTNPTAGDVHVNAPLTNFAQKWLQSQDMFVASRAMPNAPVEKQSDLYYEFSREDFFRDEAQERADGTESAGGGFDLSTSPYFCRVYAFHKDVTDRQRANADDPVRLDEAAAQFVTLKMLIKKELLFRAAYFTTGIWGTDLSPSTKWNAASSTPIAEIRTAIRTVHNATGMRPNRMLIGRPSWDALLDNDDVLSRITGGSTKDIPAIVMRELIAQLFELETIEVFDSVVNSAPKGATESTAFIGADNCLIYYAPQAVALDVPSAGVQFSWRGLFGSTANGIRIKRFRHEPTASDRIEGEIAVDFKKTAAVLGYMLNDTNS